MLARFSVRSDDIDRSRSPIGRSFTRGNGKGDVKGYLALLLHCHLPYVRHPEHDDFLEEDWFYEAVSETYVPLLDLLEGLDARSVPFRLALSFSPTLCEMFANDLLRQRCVRYLERHLELAEKEVARLSGTAFEASARMYREHYVRVYRTYVERCSCDVLKAFGRLAERGRVELLGSAATHALLPLLTTREGLTAQVTVGIANFEKHFGWRPSGFWLPECAYSPGVEALLAEFGIRYFVVDTHGLLMADPKPRYGVFAPLATPAGTYAFGRDFESSRQVWSAQEGYPGDPAYRDFYRDLGYDADLRYVRPYLPTEGVRRYLGFKYHRVTGDVPLERKEPYDPAAAARRAAIHAQHFVDARVDQVRRVGAVTSLNPLIVSPYDGELFGHWWFEGIRFIGCVFGEVARRSELTCVTPSQYLGWHCGPGREPLQPGRPAMSTWGDRGYFEVWVNGSNDWIYPRLHRAETAMVKAAARFRNGEGLTQRALNQCARQLMLAQSSDWPFLMATGTARDYAVNRFEQLLDRFDQLHGQLMGQGVEPRILEAYERLDDAFPEMDYRAFRPDVSPSLD